MVYNIVNVLVSTHSRPKAAGFRMDFSHHQDCRFNTQPPEGGWLCNTMICKRKKEFQHTAARRRLDKHICIVHICIHVSTHSRPKAAGCSCYSSQGSAIKVSTHSRPKAAGIITFTRHHWALVSTHSRPKAAGTTFNAPACLFLFQHTAARRRLGMEKEDLGVINEFQHTAARRRLV